MDVTSGHAPLDRPAYLARITTRDGRAVEEAMAGATLMDNGARLDGAVVEASYAFDRPPLLKRLGDDKVPRIIDPQTLRFVGENFLDIERLRRLPYAPDQPIAAASFDAKAARTLSRDALIYAQDRGTDLHLAPALPLFDKNFDVWRQQNAVLLAAACAANGGSELERRPLIAQVAPGNKALADPAPLVDVLLDHPVDGVYVQALRLQPTADSLEKLARFVQFVRALDDAGFPGCCRFRPLEELGSRARIHYLHVRRAEVDRAAALPAAALRLHGWRRSSGKRPTWARGSHGAARSGAPRLRPSGALASVARA